MAKSIFGAVANVVPFPSPVPGSFLMVNSEEKDCDTGEKIQEKQPVLPDELLADLECLSAMDLRRKYHREASSHKNLKSRAPRKGGKVSSEFEDFRCFLRAVGVMPGPGRFTLDRIDNGCPDYGPGLVRWATPTEQNRNKGDTVFLTASGETRSLAEWAEVTGQAVSTLRGRRRRGLPDSAVIFGGTGARSFPGAAKVFHHLTAGFNLSPEVLVGRYEQTAKSMTPGGVRESPALWLAVYVSQVLDSMKEELTAQAQAEDLEGIPMDTKLVRRALRLEELKRRATNHLRATEGRVLEGFDRSWLSLPR